MTDRAALFSFNAFHSACLNCVLDRVIAYYSERLLSLAVFGSYARGEPRFNSDLDLLVIRDSPDGPRRSRRTEEFFTHIESHCEKMLQSLFEQGILMDLQIGKIGCLMVSSSSRFAPLNGIPSTSDMKHLC